jgi:hypothetical protein
VRLTEKQTAERPTNIFALVATPSPELLRRLLYHAVTGNEFIITPFRPPEGGNGPRAQAAREKKEREDRAWVQMVMASQERIARFQDSMKRWDIASEKALDEIREDLRKAKKEWQRMKDEAREITFPDGTRRRVFRDGENVRDEQGTLVSSDIAKAEDVSHDPRQWAITSAFGDEVKRLEVREARVLEFQADRHERMRELERKSGGNITSKALDEVEAELEKIAPDEVRRHYEPGERYGMPDSRRSITAAEEYTGSALQSKVSPTFAFSSVAPGVAPEPKPDQDFRPPTPAVSTNAPK